MPPEKVKKKRRIAESTFPMDAVSADSSMFDGEVPGSYSKKNPERQFGTIDMIWPKRNLVRVEWIGGTNNLCKVEDLRLEKIKVNAAFIVTVMMMEALAKPRDSTEKQYWAKDFFHALVSPEWREWVLAVKKEIHSWLAFNAYSTIPFRDRTPGASIVPLGELYKRDGAFKFRQYLMGNLLKKGKDYDETFSSCISWDGIR